MKRGCNKDIYDLVANYNLRLWQVAYALNLHDSNFTRLLRRPLSPERRKQVLVAIEKLSKGDQNNG